MLVLGLIMIVTVGYYISILAKGPDPVHICEYVEGSGNQYVCTYNNPHLSCTGPRYDPANDMNFWDCHA